MSSGIGIGIWRDDFDDDGARDRVRRVSRQLLSQGIYNIEVFLCLSLVCDVAADCDDDDVHPFFLVESLTKTRVLLFSSVKKHVSTPTFMPGDVTVCREYQHEACCTLDTVRKCVVVYVVLFLYVFFFFLLLLFAVVVCAHNNNAVGPKATGGGGRLSFDLFSHSSVRSWKLTRARVLFFARF